MVSVTNLVEHGYAVKDLVHCAQCGSPMLFDGSEFSCPLSADASQEGCLTPSWHGDQLLRAVVGCLVGRLMNDEVTQEVVEAADQTMTQDYQGITAMVGQIEGRLLADLEEELAKAQAGESTHDPSLLAGIIRALQDNFQNAEVELQSAESLISLYAAMRNPEGLKETAQDPKTYLDHAAPADTRHLIGLFVEEIRVGPDSLELVYINPLPDEENRASIALEKIEP